MLPIEPRVDGPSIPAEEMRKRLGPGWNHLCGLRWSKCSHPAGWFILVAPVTGRKAGQIVRNSLSSGYPHKLPKPGYELNLGELPSEATLWIENKAGVYWLKIA